jgi:N-acetyl sugar amidotransferase
MIRFCKRCVYSELHPLGITLDKDGICSGCRVHEEKYVIDWHERKSRLTNIVNEYKSKDLKNYDCIVPVTGAGDSFYIVHVVKNIMGLNPLLVHYNSQFNTAIGIKNLSLIRTLFDCDLLIKTVNPDVVKKISRKTLREFASIYWHVEAGKTSYPVQVACQYKIPLIIWGAHQGVDQVGMFSHLDEVEMTEMYRAQHDLMGVQSKDLINLFEDIDPRDVTGFSYPDKYEIANVGVRGIYLNNFFKWDSKLQHEQMIKIYGYETSLQTRTFDTYNHSDCWNYSDLHDYIKYIKHGFGKVVDHASREIRLGRLSRKNAIRLVKKYNHKLPKNSQTYFDWLGIRPEGFEYILNQFRSTEFWDKSDLINWASNSNYYTKLSESKGEEIFSLKKKKLQFIKTKNKDHLDSESGYTLIGKGI